MTRRAGPAVPAERFFLEQPPAFLASALAALLRLRVSKVLRLQSRGSANHCPSESRVALRGSRRTPPSASGRGKASLCAVMQRILMGGYERSWVRWGTGTGNAGVDGAPGRPISVSDFWRDQAGRPANRTYREETAVRGSFPPQDDPGDQMPSRPGGTTALLTRVRAGDRACRVSSPCPYCRGWALGDGRRLLRRRERHRRSVQITLIEPQSTPGFTAQREGALLAYLRTFCSTP